jgi:hypothetical protein
MVDDTSCTARFERRYGFIDSVDPPQSGLIVRYRYVGPLPVPDTGTWFDKGTELEVVPMPAMGWVFEGWAGRDADKCATGSVVMNDDVICVAQFSPIPFPPTPGHETWMKDVAAAIEDRRLMDVVLPGSHDAGTYALTENGEWVIFDEVPPLLAWIQKLDVLVGKTPRALSAAWSRTQGRDQSIYWQLKGGIRYFDLRFTRGSDGKAYIYHGFYRGKTHRDIILDDVELFLGEEGHEKEIIILDLTKWHDMGSVTHFDFVAEILRRFEDKMIPEADWDKPLSEIWDPDYGRQLVVKYQDLELSMLAEPADYDLFWTDNETPLFSVGLDYKDELEGGVLSPGLRQEFADHACSLADEATVETKVPGSRWQINDKGPCSQGYTVRIGASGQLVIGKQDPVLCRPWAATYERGTLYNRLTDYLEYGCCRAAGYVDPRCCQCSPPLSPMTDCAFHDKLFELPGLLTPDFDMIKCGVARNINDWLDDNKLKYCLIPVLGARCAELAIFSLTICSNPPPDAPTSVWELVNEPDSASTEVAEKSAKWWKDCEYHARDNLNIISVDFYDESNLVDTAIAINRGDYNNEAEVDTSTVVSERPSTEGTPVVVSADFLDIDTCDHHTASIEWGDGTGGEGEVDQDGHTVTGSHIYADNGSYTVKVCVRDGVAPYEGYVYHYSQDCYWWPVGVQNVAPSVDAGRDQIIYEGDVLDLDPATFSDPGFDCPGCVGPSEENFSATIDWGDGSEIETVLPEDLHETPGSYDPATGAYAPTTGTVAGSHQYLAGPGVYPVTVCVKDDDDGETCDSLEVIVVHGFMRYCAYANQDAIQVHEGVQVACSAGGEGHIQLKLESEVDGNVVGRDDIVLGQEAYVGGDARAAGQVTLKQGATVVGDIVNNADLLSITQVGVGVSACGSGVTVAPGSTSTLAPGCYKELKVKKNATLKLTAGHYTFERIEANTNSRLVFELPDGGQVVIDVARAVHLEEGVVMTTIDGSAADILFRVAGRSVKLGKDGAFLGTFIAPAAHIDQHEGAELRGMLYGRKVQVKKDAQVIGESALDLFIDWFVR